MKTKSKQKLEEIIKKSTYYYVNENLTTNNFPIPKTIETENWEIMTIDKTMLSQEVLNMMKSKGLRPGNSYELALWANTHREEVPKGKWYVALGQSWEVPDGCHRVPSVSVHAYGDFGFVLGDFEGVWGDGNAFFGFRDSSLDTSNLKKESSYSLTLSALESRVQKLEEIVQNIRKALSE